MPVSTPAEPAASRLAAPERAGAQPAQGEGAGRPGGAPAGPPANPGGGRAALLLSSASGIYATGARLVRAWRSRPWRRRRLRRPVVSVGALAVGGRGKTPLVEHVAALLREAGERPAVLSRGYGRQTVEDGVVVVRDARRVRADLARSGDEPLMLARSLDGVAVLVSPDRYLAGVLAESRLGCTVHVLDDGFQHVELERDVDLLLVEAADVRNGRTLPAGWLREPIDAMTAIGPQGAVVAADGEAVAVSGPARASGIEHVFALTGEILVPRLVEPWGAPPRVPRSAPVLAVAGIARPDRFAEALRGAGWNVVDLLAFRDHHPYGARDVGAIAARARRAGAELVLTTLKDVMRLLPLRPLPVPVAWVPYRVAVEPAAAFRAWLLERLAAAGRR
jgi:tetraacyldisaccharide 4'-kinase